MKKNNIKKFAAILATAEALTLSGCRSKNEVVSQLSRYQDYYDILDYSIEYGEDGCYTETFEVAPVIKYYMEPVPSNVTYLLDGKEVSEPTTTYVKRFIYAAPNEVTRVEGTGQNMRCFIDIGSAKTTILEDGKEVESLSYGFIYDKPYLDLGDGYYQSVLSGDIYREKTETMEATAIYDSESNTTQYACPSGCTLSGDTCSKTIMENLKTVTDDYEPIQNAYYHYDSKEDKGSLSCQYGYFLDGHYCYDEDLFNYESENTKKLAK